MNQSSKPHSCGQGRHNQPDRAGACISDVGLQSGRFCSFALRSLIWNVRRLARAGEMNIKVTSVDYAPEDVYAQTPFSAPL
jgi:hypothetical protein